MPLRVSLVPPLLRDHDARASGQACPRKLRQHLVHAIGFSVVEKVRRTSLSRRWLAERGGDELRSECRAADADDEHILERALRPGNLAAVNFRRERLECRERLFDGLTIFGAGRERGVAQPVMPDHAFLVGIRDGALL